MGKARFSTALAVILGTLALIIGGVGAATAHVRVSATDATQGGYGLLTFRVPTESDTASTTALTVTFPDDTPVLAANPQPKAGWSVEVVKKNLTTPRKDDDGNTITQYVSQVIWKADTPQAAIPPEFFDTFSLLAGPLPTSATVSIPAAQTYSDGKIVNWNEKAVAGQAEPDHPAPVLKLAAAESDSTPATSSSSSGGGSTSWPGIVGLIIAIIALLVGLANLALLRKDRSPN